MDPCGFLVGRLDGEPVVSISVVRYGADFAFLGCYIARPKVRGKGYGIQIWRAGMALAPGRNVGLDGVVAQQDNYRKSGFTFAHRTLRYSGVPTVGLSAGARSGDLVEVGEDAGLVRAVADFDRHCYPADRPGFVTRWVADPHHTAYACLRDGRVAGYGVIRPARDGHRIGPLFADTAQDAAALFDALSASATGSPVMLDVPEPNQAGLALAKSRGLEAVFETARMYTGPVRPLSSHKIFGVTTLELG
jgi:hypothetical protein